MKASRDGGKQKVEPAVLFPRLHVSDTEKAGPRAPPRNKMALYEQFTIPSNRLLPPSLPLPRSSRAAPYSQQYISAEYGYPCTPYYLQPTLAYRRADADSYSFHPPCMGISVNGAVTYGDSEFPRVPRMQSTLKSEVSRQGAKSAAAHGTRSQEKPPGKKSRADDDNRVPVFSTQNPAVKCLQKSSEVRGRHSSSAAKSSATIPSSNTVDSHAELTEHSRDRSEMVPGIRESISGSHHRKHLDDHTCNMQEEQICSRNATSQSVVFERQSSLHPQVKQKYTCENIISQQLNKETCAASLNTGTLSQCTDAGESMCGTQDNLLVDSNNKLGEDCNKIKSGVAAKLYTSKQYSQVPKESIEKAGQNIECILEHPSTGNGFESTGESENISHGSGEVLEPSQPGDRSGSDDSDLSMLDSSSAPKILPRDLMKLVGQWQFWKARKTIIRQQQLFSDQVFELHKLIQVQRMLAETPDSVPDDNMYCDPASDTDKCILGASNDSVDQAKRKSVNYSAAAAAAKDTTGYVLGQGPYSKNDYCPSLFNGNSTLNYDPYGHMYLTPIPSSPAAMPGGVVWGYPCPSIGIPIAETPSSGSLGSNQLAELPYNSHQKQVSVPVGQQSQSAIFDNHEQTLVTPDSSTLLHSGMAYSFHSLQGMAATPSTLSVANQNKCEKSVEQITPANVSYESQWVSRITGQSGCKGYKSPISQAQHTNISISSGTCTSNVVSPSPILDGHMSGQHAEEPYVPGQNVEIVGHTYDVDRSHNTSEGALERGSKRCRKVFGGLDESKVPDDGESDEGNSDHFGNALPLFPLSPGTNSSFQGRLTTQAEGQGRVIRITPRAAVAAPKSAAGILLSIQQERAR